MPAKGASSHHAKYDDPDVDWMDDANPCKSYSTNSFFPTDGGAGLTRAKALCSTCPNRISCLNYAIRNHIVYGVWGGTSERERGRIARTRRLAARLDNDSPHPYPLLHG